MEEKEKNEKLIGELMNKRKQANDAFAKILNAVVGKTNPPEPPSKSKSKKS